MKGLIFRLTTGIAAVYHVILGIAMLVLPAEGLAAVKPLFLGFVVEVDPQLAMAGKFAGSYVLAFGVTLALLCARPQRMRALVVPALVLFGIRLANKLVFMSAIEEAFGVTRGRGLFAVATLAVIFGLIAWSRPEKPETPGKP